MIWVTLKTHLSNILIFIFSPWKLFVCCHFPKMQEKSDDNSENQFRAITECLAYMRSTLGMAMWMRQMRICRYAQIRDRGGRSAPPTLDRVNECLKGIVFHFSPHVSKRVHFFGFWSKSWSWVWTTEKGLNPPKFLHFFQKMYPFLWWVLVVAMRAGEMSIFLRKILLLALGSMGLNFFKKNWLLVQVLLLGFVGIGRSDVGLQRLPPPEALGGGWGQASRALPANAAWDLISSSSPKFVKNVKCISSKCKIYLSKLSNIFLQKF